MPRNTMYSTHRDPTTGRQTPLPNTLTRRMQGQCEYCLHYGTDCRCHRRKYMPVSKVYDKVYVVTEEEPDTNTEFPFIVIGTYRTRASAEARIAYERKVRGLQDDAAYENADISWEIEETKVWP